MSKKMRTNRVLILLIVLSLVFVVGDYLIRSHLVLPGFAELERQEAVKDVTRCKNAIDREVRHVERLSTDWAMWDDLYHYAVDHNPAFVASNLQWETLANTGIHLLYIVDTSGSVVYGGIIEPRSGQPIEVSQLQTDAFPNDHFLLGIPDGENSFAGVLLTDFGPLLLASHRILNSLGEGPERGVFLLGRFFNDEAVSDLRQQIQVDFSIRDPLSRPFSAGEKDVISKLAAVVDDFLTLARGVSSSRENNNLNAILAEYIESAEFQNLQSLHGHDSWNEWL